MTTENQTPSSENSLGISRTQFALIFLGSVALVSAVIAGVLWQLSKKPVQGGDFTLQNRSAAWTFSAHAKKLNVLYVGYVKCPDVCPMSLSFTAQGVRKLSADELKNLQVVFISVDAENDTPDSVADYAQQFYPDFVGLTGSKEKIDETIAKFGAGYVVEKNPDSYLGYSISHSDVLYFLDKNGNTLDFIMSPRSAETIVEKLKEHL